MYLRPRFFYPLIQWDQTITYLSLPEVVCAATASLLFVGESADGRWGSFASDAPDMTLDTRSGDSPPPGVTVAELTVWYWSGEDVDKNW